jgi:plasmid stability protein
MPAIHIRDLSRATLERLKARAQRNDRSLQAELKSILEEAAATDWSGTRALAAKLRKTLARRAHSDSSELIAADRRAR